MIITNKEQLYSLINDSQSQGRKVLIKKGVFDILHPGHIYALKRLKNNCDTLIIFAQSDELTKQKKGTDRPINSQQQRAEVLEGIKYIDYIYLDQSNSREEYLEILKYLQPYIVAITKTNDKKTKDYTNSKWILKEFPDKEDPTYSTTNIINRIRQQNI
jgi:glycerol-3-phosphate cytidylyltransferase